MPDNKKSFTIAWRGRIATVETHAVGGATVYRIYFDDNHPPLVITRASNAEDQKWWTSIPEGRLGEAKELGMLIEEYIRTNK